MAALRSIQQQLQDSVTEYRQMQQEVSSVVNQQMKLQQQVNETSMVQQELEMLGDGNGEGVVYKLVGPLLVRQDTYEAKANVGKRLEFIKKEMYAVPTNPLASRVVRSPSHRSSRWSRSRRRSSRTSRGRSRSCRPCRRRARPPPEVHTRREMRAEGREYVALFCFVHYCYKSGLNSPHRSADGTQGCSPSPLLPRAPAPVARRSGPP